MLKTLASILVCLSLIATIACVAPQPTPTATPVPTATPTPTATPVPIATPTPTATPVPLPTLEFIPDRSTLSGGVEITGYIGDWRLGEGPHPQHKHIYTRNLRNVADQSQQYTCFYYPDSPEEVPRVNLAFPYPLKITATVNQLAVNGTTRVGGETIRVLWQTWTSRKDRLVLRDSAARNFIEAIIERQGQEFTLTLPDNPDLSTTYSTVGLVQALEFNGMLDCYR